MDDTISSIGTIASPVKLNSKLNGFKILCKLGEGSFSIVYKVQRYADNKIYAMKKVLMSRLNEKEKANSLNEIRILASIKNDHVIEYRESFFDESSNTLCIIMEYAGQGDLLSKLKEYKQANKKLREETDNNLEQKQYGNILLKKQESNPLSNCKISFSCLDQQKKIDIKVLQDNYNSEEQQLIQQPKEQEENFIYIEEELIWDYLLQCLKGLKCLHDMKILHRDLKLANVFVGAHNIIKIGDLNVSKVTQCAELMAKTQTGTPYYTAPEVWQGLEYNHKSDVWSLGCIIYELCAQKHPFSGNTIDSLFTSILKGQYLRIPSYYSDELAFIISQCLQLSPNQRLSCNELLELSCFESRKSRYIEIYKPYLSTNQKQNQKQKYQIQEILETMEQNNFSDAVLYHYEFTPQRQQTKDCEYLIDTIKLPSNMKQLSSLLPESNYDDTPILPSSITKYDDSTFSNYIPLKSKFEKKCSIEKVSEFQQIDEIISARSSLSSDFILNDLNNEEKTDNVLIEKGQIDNSIKQENIFQVLLDLQTEEIFQFPNTKIQQIDQTEKQIDQQEKQIILEEKSIELSISQKQNNLHQSSDNQDNIQKFDIKSKFINFENQSREQQTNQEIQNNYYNNSNKKNHIALNQIDFIKQNNNSELRQSIELKNQRFIKIQKFQNDENPSLQTNQKPLQNKQQKHLYLQKVELVEQKDFSGLSMTNDTKNSISSKNSICTKNSISTKTYKVLKNNASDSKEDIKIYPQNININLENETQSQQLIESTDSKDTKSDPINQYMQKLKIKSQRPSIRNKKLLNNQISDKSIQEISYAKQNTSISQIYTLIGNETDKRISTPKFKVKNNSNQQQAVLVQNEEEQLFKKQINTLNNINANDIRNYPIKYIKQTFHDKLQKEHILKVEEDFSYYSPNLQQRGFAIPLSAISNSKRQSVNKKISSASQQRHPHSSSNLKRQDKSMSPSQLSQQSPYIISRQLPKVLKKNREQITERIHNNSIHQPFIQGSTTQGIQLRNRSPIKYPPILNQFKCFDQNSSRLSTKNCSIHDQINNKSQNNSNDVSLTNVSSKYTNYTLNYIQNDSYNTPPSIRSNNENVNTINILNNSFGNKQSQVRSNKSKDNNFTNAYYEKSVQPQNKNRIHLSRQLKTNQKQINSYQTNRNPSSPKKSQNQVQQRRNIFQIPNNNNNKYTNFCQSNNNVNVKQNKSNLSSILDRSFYEVTCLLQPKSILKL